ncbi:NAD(FAD)-utilizing dehydrogenase [Candidatus Rhodobacter oscarellae]|uniref:NAD(FAD)-utilizing dehydrogenase n=1 Tax=Candidatus Rhodobacter oscarellae TaxID=1675527 RepID=A0A0J9E2B4_9RHOB|nr:NAD(P)/FAD-dependent oxidoreductase [Candidatus Rhodobacter lobularis]KMW57001.1 NAD(FAD)-utilizing dehydrogenase [Candidatus Rhodobacter lobularis]
MQYDTIIIGAGAAGMFCAAHCGGRVLVVDHAKAPGEKIRISGGGRCNFTNMYCGPENFLSENPHFAKSALARYTQWDFIDLVARHGIAYHEKTLGQLFCDGSAKEIIAMLRAMMARAELRLQVSVTGVEQLGGQYRVGLSDGTVAHADNLVVACGGKSIPKMGATGFAYDIARQFGHRVTETRAGLVPFVFSPDVMAALKPLAGVATPARVRAGAGSFQEAILVTHRGLSGPACLQASSYWAEGEAISVDLDPEGALLGRFREVRARQGRRGVTGVLSEHLPERLARHMATEAGLVGNVADLSDARLEEVVAGLRDWQLKPVGTEGYRTAEVTLGGVDTAGLSSKTMESKTVPRLYFIGECVDVTGWLGGYNFQWAWSSAFAAATAITQRAA